jgi:uncharacterized membrane protein YeaQ/YmgE (transglycosylase-associated protein family)
MSIISFFLAVVIAMIIGTVANKLSPLDMPGGWAGAIFAGFVGTWVGKHYFGTWGPVIEGFALVPAMIGAFIVVVVCGIVAKLFDNLGL